MEELNKLDHKDYGVSEGRQQFVSLIENGKVRTRSDPQKKYQMWKQ